MTVDTVFFDRIIKMLETNHNLVRSDQDGLKVTEAWLAFGDQIINQAKIILKEQIDEESRLAIMTDLGDLMSDDFDQELFEIAMRRALEAIKFINEEE